MTEDEAKTKWCPFVRLSKLPETRDNIGGSFDNRGNDYHEVNCIASDCMAWRKGGELTWSLADEIAYKNMSEADRALFKSPEPKQGYCGLAGQFT